MKENQQTLSNFVLPKRFDSVIIQNKIQTILEQKGFRDAVPSAILLKNIGGFTKNKFTRILRNRAQPTFEETYLIAAWLNVDLADLYDFQILPLKNNFSKKSHENKSKATQ